MSVYATRRDNLRALIRQWGGTSGLARQLGHRTPSYLSQLAGPHPTREVSERTAREVEKSLDLPAGWMDKVQVAHHPTEMDSTLVGQVIDLVGKALGQRTVPSAIFAELVALAYEHAAGKGAPDERYIERLIKLTKGK